MSADLEQILELAAAQLGEHFDVVQILASTHLDGGGTRCVKRGVGNWYARQGMAHEFIENNIAEDQACAIAERLNEDNE